MNQSNVGLLDLSNEILLIILKKLDNMDVLYSLLDVDNQQLDIIAQENIFTNTLNLSFIVAMSSLFDDSSSYRFLLASVKSWCKICFDLRFRELKFRKDLELTMNFDFLF